MARTRVTNISGVTQVFGFIPPHGKSLEHAHAVDLDGDLRTVLAGGRNRYGRPTELAALTAAEENGQVLVEALLEPSSSSSSSSSA